MYMFKIIASSSPSPPYISLNYCNLRPCGACLVKELGMFICLFIRVAHIKCSTTTTSACSLGNLRKPLVARSDVAERRGLEKEGVIWGFRVFISGQRETLTTAS